MLLLPSIYFPHILILTKNIFRWLWNEQYIHFPNECKVYRKYEITKVGDLVENSARQKEWGIKNLKKIVFEYGKINWLTVFYGVWNRMGIFHEGTGYGATPHHYVLFSSLTVQNFCQSKAACMGNLPLF
jgi:hypothetical protein